VRLHARCVWVFVCLGSFFFFVFFHTAIAQDTSLASSNRAVTKIGKTLWQVLLGLDLGNVHSPVYG